MRDKTSTTRTIRGRTQRARDVRAIIGDGLEHDAVVLQVIAHEQRRAHRPPRVSAARLEARA